MKLIFNAIVGLGVLGALEIQRSPVQISSDAEFYDASKSKLVVALLAAPLGQGSDLERMIVAEMSRLDQIAGFVTPVQVAHGSGISSHPEAGIIADVDALARIRGSSSLAVFLPALRWILAHEKAHQIQFRTYPAWRKEAAVERRALEAQADILAGKYLIESIDSNAPADHAAIRDALRLAFDLGSERYALADHPRRESRLTAARLGMSAGMLVKLRALGPGPAWESANHLAQKLDVRPHEDLLTWSRRTATRIVNGRSKSIVDLILVDSKIDWDERPSNPLVSYQLTYENRGQQQLQIELEVQCAAVPRGRPQDVLAWQKINADHHAFVLAPGARTIIKGSMMWTADVSLMPKLIFPPDKNALIIVDAGDQPTPEQTAGASLAVTSTAGQRQEFESVLLHAIGASANGFRSLRDGPGRDFETSVRYFSASDLGDAIETTVSIPQRDSRPRFVAMFEKGSDAVVATTKYEDVVRRTRLALATLGTWTSASHSDSNSDRTTFDRPALIVEVSRRKNRTEPATYDVTLTITKLAVDDQE